MATNTRINNKDYYRIRRKIDGKTVSFYGTSKGDAEKKYDAFLKERARKMHSSEADFSSASFGDRAKDYVENTLRVSQRFATATKQQYEASYNVYVKDSDLSKKILSQIRPSDVQKFYNGLDVSRQTMSRVNKFMTNFCKWCVLNNYSSDFMTAVEIPKKPDNSRHDGIVIWEDNEIREILRSMNNVKRSQDRHRMFFMVHLLLYTGARISEALALKYTDLENGLVRIERQCYMGEMKPPKYNSSRTIPMHHKLAQALKAHERWHIAEMRRNGYKTDYVFTTSTGRLYDAKSIRTALKRFYISRGIPVKHPHAYRSTFCTQLCRCGVPLEVASKLLGHKSMEVTAEHYALVRNDTKQEAIEMLKY